MSFSALYNLYTDDYSADSIRKNPATAEELIHKGISANDVKAYLHLSEALYESFLSDTLNEAIPSENTLAIWQALYSLASKQNIIDEDVPNRFPLYAFDIVLSHGNNIFPRGIKTFRLCLEQRLSMIDLAERKLEYEYDLQFVASEDLFWRAVRFNVTTHSMDDIPQMELHNIVERIRNRRQKIDKQIEPKLIRKQIYGVLRDQKAIKSILEQAYDLIDEQNALESLETRLTEILNQPPIHNLSRKDLLWVIMGNDICKEEKHHILDIRAKLEFYNGTVKTFPIRRCAICKQYQISFEAFEAIWREHGLPKIEPIYIGVDGDIGGTYWNDRSIFSDHGYSVSQEKGLTATQRQQKLKWIIDHGIRSKHETIRFLRSRISINGMKPENWLARSKWEEDLRYVQSL